MKRIVGRRVIGAWEYVLNVAAEKEVNKMMIRCGTSAKWWDDELRKATKERR